MNKFKNFMASTTGKIVSGVTGAALVVLVPSVSGADVISSAFTTEQTTLLGYLGNAVTLIIALLSLGVGIRFLVKWVRKAASGS